MRRGVLPRLVVERLGLKSADPPRQAWRPVDENRPRMCSLVGCLVVDIRPSGVVPEETARLIVDRGAAVDLQIAELVTHDIVLADDRVDVGGQAVHHPIPLVTTRTGPKSVNPVAP